MLGAVARMGWGRTGSLRSFRAVAANPDLRRVELAFVGFAVVWYCVRTVLLVVAYEAGGATTAGLVGVSQLLPAALVAPFAAVLIDRYRRERVLAAGYLAQGGGLAAVAAALAADAPILAVYGLAALAAVPMAVTRPAQTALLADLARTAEELTAATVVTGAIENLGLVAGPAAAGVLLGVSGAGGVFAGMAAVAFGCALLAAPVAVRPAHTHALAAPGAAGLVADLRDGIEAATREPRSRSVVAILSALALVRGATVVMFAVLAFRLFDTGSGGTAFLNAAFGVGAVLGAVAAAPLAGRPRLAPVVLGGALAWAVGLGAIGLAPNRLSTPLLLGLAGAGRPLIEVTGRLFLLRGVPDRVLGRVFGVLEGLGLAGFAIGLLVEPVAVETLGTRAALVATGLVLPAAVLLGWRRLTEIDAAAVVPLAALQRLRAVPIFAPLSPPVLERLAGRLVPVAAPAGTAIIREGGVGDRFYVLDAGEVDVTVAGRLVDAHGPGGFFGEIALLRDVPRTATVTARTAVRLYALDRDDFLAAVTGHAASRSAADAVARARFEERLARERAAAEQAEERV